MVAIKVARQFGRVSPAPAALPGETVTCVARLLLIVCELKLIEGKKVSFPAANAPF